MELAALLGQLLQTLTGLLPLLLADYAGSRQARLSQLEHDLKVKDAQLACSRPGDINTAVSLL
jgi:hypothetical protein